MDGRIDRVAREAFGFDALRPGQREAIESVLAGRDTLVVMSTGSGKSAVYQIAGLLIEGRHRGRLPLDRPPARPGRGPRRPVVGRRRAAQLEPAGGRPRARPRGAGGGRARVPLPGSRAARQRGGAGRAGRGAPVAAGRRRGALHLRVGPRLPARVPAPRGGRRGPRASDDPRPHRHGGAARARRDRRAARHARSAAAGARVRPAEHPAGRRALPRGAVGRAQAAGAAGRGRVEPEAGDRLRRHAAPGRGGRRGAVRALGDGRVLPRGHEGGRARCRPGALHGRRARGGGRHHGVRHGDRQGRRAVGVPQRGLRVARRLLPGARALGARRRAGAGHALLPQRGSRAAAVLRGRRARRRRRDRTRAGGRAGGSRARRSGRPPGRSLADQARDGDLPFAVGARVAHGEWGEGVVQRYDDDSVVVLFDEVGYKTLALEVIRERGLLAPA